jgi:hypothetical protein
LKTWLKETEIISYRVTVNVEFRVNIKIPKPTLIAK